NKKDALAVREYTKDHPIEIVAKIEDSEGVDNIAEILKVVDGVMVARGGLGVEMGIEQVPIVERKIIRTAIGVGKPVITATQMLDSMERNIIPTRAEANDVATAILLGSDAVMLSGESTAGKYPAESVAFMARTDQVATELIEPGIVRHDRPEIHGHKELSLFTEMIFKLLSEREDIKGIVYTSSNKHQISLLARHHIERPIFAFVDTQIKAQQMLLRKNIADAFVVEDELDDREEAIDHFKQRVSEEKLFEVGEKYLLLIDLFQEDTAFPEIFEIVTQQ
ncbi:MAG: pyruvate kinase, partial [Candidatus Dojkabacteria bacterium]